MHLKLPSAQSTYKLPINAIIFRTEGVRIAVVGADGKVALQPVTLGRDYGNSLEVVSGITGRERIIVNAPDSIEAGQTVRIAEAGQGGRPDAADAEACASSLRWWQSPPARRR